MPNVMYGGVRGRLISPYSIDLAMLVILFWVTVLNSTRLLWYDFLKNYSEKFTGQNVLGKYISDFYCAKANIVIELDGSQHKFILTLRKTYAIIKLRIE